MLDEDESHKSHMVVVHMGYIEAVVLSLKLPTFSQKKHTS